ncbi:MAG: hypothetical protein ABWZ80_05665 [Beijerinckiaceae bacterium]
MRNRLEQGLRAALITGAAILAPSIADARVCQVPRALLCDGCSERLTITLMRSGRCVVSALPGRGQSTAASPYLTVRVNVAPVAPTLRKRSIRRQTAESTVAFGPIGSRCFIFRDRRYCE